MVQVEGFELGRRRTFCQPMISAFSRKSRRVMLRPYLRMIPCCEPEHLPPEQTTQLHVQGNLAHKKLHLSRTLQ